MLKNGFKYGFNLGYQGPRRPVFSKNLRSAAARPNIVLEKLFKEVEAGRMAGPFASSPLRNLRISPVGLVPKSDGGWRLITHLSYPRSGGSINDGISQELKSVSYTKFDTVVDMVFSLGKSALMAKRDIRSAFRLLPVSPLDFELLGIHVDGKIFINLNMPFGASCAPFYFETFSSFIHWLVKDRSNIPFLDHYLDDFIFCGAKGTDDCQTLISTFHQICGDLGVPINDEKSTAPSTVMVFLGLEIDSDNMQIRIPYHKRQELEVIIQGVLKKDKITLRDLQSLTGKLCFFAQAIRSSRAFLRRFYDAMAGVKREFYKIRITHGMREDLRMWLEFLSNFNGICPMPDFSWSENETLKLFTDSAGQSDLGCGCYFDGKWAFFQWPLHWARLEVMKDITFLEMVPVLLCMFLWSTELQNKKIILRTDNEALVAILNKQSTKSKRIMRFLRCFVLLCMRYNVIFKAIHISTKLNDIADSISRKQWARLSQLVPESAVRVPVPKGFHDMIYRTRLDA